MLGHKIQACLVILFLQYFQNPAKFHLPAQHYILPPMRSKVAQPGNTGHGWAVDETRGSQSSEA